MILWLTPEGKIRRGDPENGDVEIEQGPSGTTWNGTAWVIDTKPFIAQVDADVDNIYNIVIGKRQVEYETAEREALACLAANYIDPAVSPTPPSWPSVSSWAFAKNWTLQQAADDIIGVATGWRTAQNAIRSSRLLRKEQLKVATTDLEVKTIMSNWNGFVGYMKTQLGIS